MTRYPDVLVTRWWCPECLAVYLVPSEAMSARCACMLGGTFMIHIGGNAPPLRVVMRDD